MKFFAGGIATETNTFSPVPTGRRDFFVQRGRAMVEGPAAYPSLDLTAVWGQQARDRGHEFVFSLNAWAAPSGITTRATYETLRDELLADLRAALPVDVVLLMLHGAMVAQGYDSCEQDIITQVRAIAGERAIIGVELDLHCHLNEQVLAGADIVVIYKEYPHVDMNARAREVFDLSEAAALGTIKPTMALFDCRMVGMYPTTRQPLRDFVDSMSHAEGQAGVLSISFGHGFPYADVPYVGAKLLVITDNDRALATRVAADFGKTVYGLRHQIGFESISLGMEQAFARAMRADAWPVVVADQSDNTGGGAPGDATFALRWMLDHRIEQAAIALFYDPEVVRIASTAGVGAKLTVRLGGKLGVASGDPIDLEVLVTAVRENYMHEFPQQSGDPMWYSAGTVVALRAGSLDLIVASERCQCFAPSIFTDLGVDPRQKRIVVVKSYQHFYSAFAPLAAQIIYMSAPGAVPADPRKLAYQRVCTEKLYPWIDDPLGA
jgi:microcystin degradation protein MlrC